MEPRCRREVIELHRFFQDWMRGDLEPTGESFARFETVCNEGFVFITPGGRLLDRSAIVDGVRGSHGSWRRTAGPRTAGPREAGSDDEKARIWIENVRLHRTEGDLAVVTYEEWQEVRGEVRGRLSSVLFRAREGTPNGVEWLHVHETWLPEE